MAFFIADSMTTIWLESYNHFKKENGGTIYLQYCWLPTEARELIPAVAAAPKVTATSNAMKFM